MWAKSKAEMTTDAQDTKIQGNSNSTTWHLITDIITDRGRNTGSHLTSTPSNAGCTEMGDNDQSQQSSTSYLFLFHMDDEWMRQGDNEMTRKAAASFTCDLNTKGK